MNWSSWWIKLLANYGICLTAWFAAEFTARYLRRRCLKKMVCEQRFQSDLKDYLDRAFNAGVEVGRARERREQKAFNN